MERISRGIKFDFVYDVDSNLGGGSWDQVVGWCVDNTTPNDTFIEVGAHLGYMSVMTHKLSKPKFSVFIEPDPRTILLLKKNLETNLEERNYEIVQSLVLDKAGEESFYLQASNPARSSCYKRFDDTLEVKVPATTIDDIVEKYHIESPIVIKIDAEFSEPRIWKGMKKSLPKIRRICMEFYGDLMKETNGTDPNDFLKEIAEDGFKITQRTSTDIYLENTNA